MWIRQPMQTESSLLNSLLQMQSNDPTLCLHVLFSGEESEFRIHLCRQKVAHRDKLYAMRP